MPDRARENHLKYAFNLTVEDWDLLDRFQNGLCFICQKRQKSGKRLATDHRHSDGLIRGLLCSQCNRLLGRIESAGWTADHINRLVIYLYNPPATQALGRIVLGYPGRVGTKKFRAWVRKRKKKEDSINFSTYQFRHLLEEANEFYTDNPNARNINAALDVGVLHQST